jgi:hypothetical protein
MIENTKEWQEYETGKDYNNRLNYYAKTDLNYRMYQGDQWVGVTTNGLPKYTFNICRSAINYFVAFILSQKVKLQYSAENVPDEPQDEQQAQIKQFCDMLSNMSDLKWEKDKMDSLLRELLIDGANSGDFCVHVYWDAKKETGQLEKGDFCTEMVDGVNIMFGNPNNRKVDPQPYVLIVGREMVSKLKEEAKENGVEQDLIDTITADEENEYQAGQYGKVELDHKGESSGKTLYLIRYWKEDGTVYWNKSTRACPIIKKRDLGISRYPVAWANWEPIKNTYHGNPVIEGIIDNQIGINQLFAMVAYWMKKQAFGNVIVDQNVINEYTNKLGQVFKVNGGGPLRDYIYQVEAGDFNAAIITVIEMAVKFTKEFIGATDTLLGQVNPEQASGVSIISTAKQASMPLGNIQAARDQFVEDLGLIWGEFFLKKYQNRLVSYKDGDKVKVDQYNPQGMSDILLQCKVDVGPSSYWSELAGLQTLDNLLANQHITKLQYFERVAKMNLIPDIQGLISDAQAEVQMQRQIQQQQAQQQQAQIQADQQNAQAQQQQEMQAKEQQYEQMAQFLETLPPEVQAKISSLPPDQMEATILQMMQQDVKNTMKGSAENGMPGM